MAELEMVDAAQIRAVHRRLYKPVNATLVVVGSFDPEAVERIVRERFGAIEPGEAPPPRPPLPAPELGAVRETKIVPPAFAGASSGVAALAFRAPDAGDDLYPAFLFLAARLYQQEMVNMRQPGAPPVSYAPLDDPRVLFLAESVAGDATNDDLERMLRDRIARATTIQPGDEPNRWRLLNFFGQFLGLTELPDALIARNPYMPALALGRLEQLGIAAADLRLRIEAVTAEDLRRCAEDVFGAERGAVAIVRPQQAAGK